MPIVGFAGKSFLILSFVSTNGGASWGKTNQVSRVRLPGAPAANLRATIPLPSAEIDASGKVDVVGRTVALKRAVVQATGLQHLHRWSQLVSDNAHPA